MKVATFPQEIATSDKSELFSCFFWHDGKAFQAQFPAANRPIPSADSMACGSGGTWWKNAERAPTRSARSVFPAGPEPGSVHRPRPGSLSRVRAAYFIVGMTNSAPSLMPLGQREVTVLVLV
jgi:protein-tyrosine-phosphatase